jgi:simple sugar transport system ATP-binding protein
MKVELKDIHKAFGTVRANEGISLSISEGTIQGILGENGAGKSTLMKILSGFIQADSGDILLDEHRVAIHSPSDAIRHGIGMLHQDPLDFPSMRVIDNFIIGSRGGIIPRRKEAVTRLLDLEHDFGFSIHPDSYIDTLTVGERQQLEILRLLWLGVHVLILDEPTTGISALQKEKLFSTLKLLATQGKTIIFVSHKLEDVEQLCHRVAVLRLGKLVGEMDSPFDAGKMVEMMFGRAITLAPREIISPGEPVLRLRDFSIEDYRLTIQQVELEVNSGEVIGLAGMEGSGQNLLLRACAGLVRPVSGKVLLGARDMTGKSYHAFLELGVAYLPASRLEEGLIPGLTIAEHVVLTEGGESPFINWEQSHKLCEGRIQDFNIRGTGTTRVEALSGGNQQRTLLALLKSPLTLLLLDNPTRGLDIESTIYIWSKLKERCQQNTAILFISSDLDEILRYSDRILVFFSGRISPSLDATTASVDLLGQLIGGKNWEKVFKNDLETIR